MNRIRWYGPSMVLLAAVLATLWLGPVVVRQITYAQNSAQITLARNSLAENPTLAELSDAYRKVAQAVEPSVVHIEVLGRSRSMMQELFNLPGPREQQEREPSPFDRFDPLPQSGNGSGWVYDDQGHIITNYHVVANAEGIRVTFFDGGKYDAKVVGADERTDVAVLKVNVENLHPAQIAEEPVQVGDIVFAFGSPLNFDFSVSQGIVSAKGRDLGLLSRLGGYENYIQTDAAINPGNSGGPLTNIYGQVVGMNSAIASRSGGWMGIGFAIPVDMARNVADQIIATGSVSRGQIGIYFANEGHLPPAMARSFGFEGEGVLINDVRPGSGADQAGLKPGDIITHVNGKPMETGRELRRFVGTFTPGTRLQITAFRAHGGGDNQTLEVAVEITAAPEEQASALGGAAPDAPALEPEIQRQNQTLDMLRNYGIEQIETFTEATARAAGITFRPGVLITDVRRGSLASPPGAAGLARGMLIVRVADAEVATAEQLLTELARHDAAQGIRIRVAVWDRGDQRWNEMFWLIQLPGE